MSEYSNHTYTSDGITYAPPYTATSSGAPMPLTINGNGSNTITMTGISTGGYTTSPGTSTHSWVTPLTPFVQHEVIRIQTTHGHISVKYDGTVEYPDELEDAAKEFWNQLGAEISEYFQDALRKEAARQVRQILPTLMPELEPYRATLMAVELAMAVKYSKN